MTIKWRICYADFTTYSNLDGSWESAPKHGVICVLVRDPTGVWGRWINSGYAPQRQCEHCGTNKFNEYYVKPPDSDEPYPTHDLTDFRARFDKPEDADPYIKTGRQVPQEIWNKIMIEASKDPDFPQGTSPRRRASDWKPDARPTKN